MTLPSPSSCTWLLTTSFICLAACRLQGQGPAQLIAARLVQSCASGGFIRDNPRLLRSSTVAESECAPPHNLNMYGHLSACMFFAAHRFSDAASISKNASPSFVSLQNNISSRWHLSNFLTDKKKKKIRDTPHLDSLQSLRAFQSCWAVKGTLLWRSREEIWITRVKICQHLKETRCHRVLPGYLHYLLPHQGTCPEDPTETGRHRHEDSHLPTATKELPPIH